MASKRSGMRSTGVFGQTYHLIKPGEPPLIKEQYTKDADAKIVRYGLVYIDHSICPEDNGRVLGYDNRHQFHERHFMGKAEKIEFTTYEEQAESFFREVDKIRKEHISGESSRKNRKSDKL